MTFLLLACAADPEPEPGRSEVRDSPEAWESEGLIPVDLPDPAVVTENVLEALAGQSAYRPASFFGVYAEAMLQADASCPRSDGDDLSAWEDPCVTELGVDFHGHAAEERYTGTVNGEGDIEARQSVAGVFQIEGDGPLLWAGGEAVWSEARHEGTNAADFSYTNTLNYLSGAWLSGAADAASWLTSGLTIDLQTTAITADTGGRCLGIEGAVPTQTSTVYFDILACDADFGMGCAMERAGSVFFRTPAGAWLEIRFDGARFPDWDFDAAACDGCGTLFWEGQAAGPLCLDVVTAAMDAAP